MAYFQFSVFLLKLTVWEIFGRDQPINRLTILCPSLTVNSQLLFLPPAFGTYTQNGSISFSLRRGPLSIDTNAITVSRLYIPAGSGWRPKMSNIFEQQQSAFALLGATFFLRVSERETPLRHVA